MTSSAAELPIASAGAEPRPSFWQSSQLAGAVFVLALALRLFSLSWPPVYIGIEDLHVPSTIAYVETGHFTPENDHATPLRKFILYPFLKFLGDNAVPRRLPNALLGALTALFLVLLGRQLFPGRRIGALAGFFLATDPFHISFSRSTWEDIPVALFMVAGLYFLVKALGQTDSVRYLAALFWSGISFALALATRRYAGALLLFILAYLVYRELKGPAATRGADFKRRLAFLLSVFMVLPVLVYSVPFYPWFARGNSWGEWSSFQQYMVRDELTDVTMANKDSVKYYGGSGSAADWFRKTIVFGSRMPVGSGTVSTSMVINNPFSWWLVLPAWLALGFAWRQKRSLSLAVLAVSFALLYLPFLAASRIILVYSALSVLPLAFLMVAWLLASVWTGAGKFWRGAGAGAAIAIVVTNLAFYPLAIALPMPQSWSKFIPFQERLSELNR